MVYSGSRHTGFRIAEHHADLARGLAKPRGMEFPSGLWSLPPDDRSAADYLLDMEWATAFALESRHRMLEGMLRALRVDPAEAGGRKANLNGHHHFARIETYGGHESIVHRKGATSAADGELGNIPGSMGAPSYIVRGKGNAESFASCSHGAGRRMGRNQAKKAIGDAAFRASLAGTISTPSRGWIDEAVPAYKDIGRVMALQRDLVDVMHELRPIVTVNGDSQAKED